MPAHSIQTLCVFCGSQSGETPVFAEAAAEVGKSLAARGIHLVYGGGSVGLMGAVANACLEAGGEVTGVITGKLLDREVGHTGVTKLEVVDTMLERKTRMAELSDAFVSLPGGMGTMDELFEMVTWGLLGLHGQRPKPNGILNVDGYYDGLVAFIRDQMIGRGFLDEDHGSNLVVSDEFDDLLGRMEAIDLVSKIDSLRPE